MDIPAPYLNFPACFQDVTPAPSLEDEFLIYLIFLQKSLSSFHYMVFGKKSTPTFSRFVKLGKTLHLFEL